MSCCPFPVGVRAKFRISLDTVQLTQMAKYLETVYVSGWQSSSTASTTNEPGPDLADYPYSTVPNKVHQLFSAQLFHDRKQFEARRTMSVAERKQAAPIDYLRPIVGSFCPSAFPRIIADPLCFD